MTGIILNLLMSFQMRRSSCYIFASMTGKILYLSMHSLNMPFLMGILSCCIFTDFTFVIYNLLVHRLYMSLHMSDIDVSYLQVWHL